MERGKYRTILASLAGGLWMLLVVSLSLAQEAKPTEEPAKAAALAPVQPQELPPWLAPPLAWLPALRTSRQPKASKAPQPRMQKLSYIFLVSFFLPFFSSVIS